jgi:hypothetical protein
LALALLAWQLALALPVGQRYLGRTLMQRAEAVAMQVRQLTLYRWLVVVRYSAHP